MMEIGTMVSPMLKAFAVIRWLVAKILFFLCPPTLEVIERDTKFGRLEGKDFALLLWVTLCNESEKTVLVKSFEVKHAGTWYKPSEHPPEHVRLHHEHGHFGAGLHRNEGITVTPRIPPSDISKRFGFFILPEPSEQWPLSLEVTVRATFPRCRSRRIPAYYRIGRCRG
jgi:hypothetical protein